MNTPRVKLKNIRVKFGVVLNMYSDGLKSNGYKSNMGLLVFQRWVITPFPPHIPDFRKAMIVNILRMKIFKKPPLFRIILNNQKALLI